jgi:choline dehydrogenase-like flavoprotein
MIRNGVSPREQTCDICIVGSGPVGIALAVEFERLGRSVLVLESGGNTVDARLADASQATIVDPARHATMEMAVCRAFGGTSWTWGGRCVAFDDVDFEARACTELRLADSPRGPQALIRESREYLRCGSDQFRSVARSFPGVG